MKKYLSTTQITKHKNKKAGTFNTSTKKQKRRQDDSKRSYINCLYYVLHCFSSRYKIQTTSKKNKRTRKTKNILNVFHFPVPAFQKKNQQNNRSLICVFFPFFHT